MKKLVIFFILSCNLFCGQLKKEIDFKEINSYFSMTELELKKSKIKYSMVPIREGEDEGYLLVESGITLVYEDGLLSFIECSEKVNISGTKIGMSLKEIKKKLGKSKIIKFDILGDDKPYYKLEYILNKRKVEFVRNDFEDRVIEIIVFRD